MSSPRSLFSKTVSKKPRIDNEDKQEHTTSQNTGRNIPSTSTRKPAFNPSLLSSAFYTGPTMYGGAGACSSSPVTQYAKSKFYDRKKTDIKVTPSTPEPPMSQTSRRILDLLEQYSSPISDAKRVPINSRPTFSAHKKTFNTSSIFDISKKSLYDESLTPNSSKAHRFRELQIPSMATLMKIKKNNHTSGNAQAAITASMSSSLPYRPEAYSLRPAKDNKTYKSKIKTKVSGRSNKVDEDEMALPVNLPNISLTMTGLPSFGVEPFRPQVTTTKPATSDSYTFSSGNLASNFKFTSPVTVSRTDMSPAATKFQFSEPLDIFSSDYVPPASPEDGTTSSPGVSGQFISLADHKRSVQCSDTLSNVKKSPKIDYNSPLINFKSGDSDTPKTSNKRPPEMWNGKDNWKIKSTEKSPLVNGDLKSSDIFGKNSHKNETAKSKDSSFNEILNPNVSKIKSDIALPPSPISGLESFIKKQQEQWECSSCMTRNDQSKPKCVCCEAAKPGASAATPAPAPAPIPIPQVVPKPLAAPAYSGMANFIKKQQDQWECSCCMTRNDQNRAKCVCCEASKPGGEPAPAAGALFNFGNTQNTFKFGIDKANDPVKPPDITSSESSKTDAVVPAPNFLFGNPTTSNTKIDAAPTGGFTFGATNGSSAGSTNATNTPTSKPNLGFGIKKDDTPASAPVGGFSFGIKKAEENKSTEPAAAPAEIKTNLFSFSSPKLANDIKTDADKPKTFGSMQNDTKVIPSLLASKSEDTSTTVASSVPAFAFGVPQSTVKPSFGNSPAFQFGSPAATTPVTSSTDSAPKPSLFSFGAKTPTAPAVSDKSSADINVTPKPAFQLPSVTSPSPLFPSSGTNPIKGTLPTTAGIQFNAGPAVEKPKDQVAPPFFGFSSPSSNSTNPSTTFKSPSTALPAFSFGSTSGAKPESSTPSLFNAPSAVNTPPSSIFGSKPAEPTTNMLFKSPTTTSSFASPTTGIFGSTANINMQTPSTNMFGSGNLNSATTKPSVPIFGSADGTSQQPQTNSLFSNTTMPTPSFNSNSIFGNMPQSGSVAPQQTASLFGNNKPPSDGGMFMNNTLTSAAPTNMFGSAMAAAAPAQTSSGMFGSSPAVPTPVFGASIPTFGEASQNQAPQNVSFKFGASSSSAPSGVGFGQGPVPAPGVFSFGSGTAPGPSNSQFNFSMGAPASSFPAPGALTAPPARRIKKAMRRNVR